MIDFKSLENFDISTYIEHTNLKPTATQADIEALTKEAIDFQLFGVCVPPYWVKKVKYDLMNTRVKLITVVGFPLGYHRSEIKVAEAGKALEEGADEIDMVMNLSAFKSGAYHWAKAEIAQLAKICHDVEASLKVIIETAYLSEREIVDACMLSQDAGADFVKTSTGFAPQGASAENVKLMRNSVKNTIGVKASGGIKNYADALLMIEAGADRIGTSAGARIIKEAKGW